MTPDPNSFFRVRFGKIELKIVEELKALFWNCRDGNTYDCRDNGFGNCNEGFLCGKKIKINFGNRSRAA